MKSILGLSVCILIQLSLLSGTFGQTSHIEMGNLNYPVIYNRTIEMPAPSYPWYKRWFGFSPPIQNVTYTLPSNQYQSCLIAGVKVNDVEVYGKGGLAKVIGGGPHFSNVTINFTSKTGSAMRFRIIITGNCIPNNSQSSSSPSFSNSLHANPMNNHAPSASYGWAVPLNSTLNNSSSIYNSSGIYNSSSLYNSSALVQNQTGTPWWPHW